MTLVKYFPTRSALAALVTLCTLAASARAAVPSDQLMSLNTRGYASLGNIEEFSEKWHQTQLGQLVQDESMRPFIEDLKVQIQRKIGGVEQKLGIDWQDLKHVAGGEVGIGLVERENERAALVMVVDISGHQQEMEALLVKVGEEFTRRGGSRGGADVSGTKFTIYTIPAKDDKDYQRTAVYFVKNNTLVATDNRAEAEEMLRRFDGAAGDRLLDSKPYQVTMERCAKSSGGVLPEVRWFVDPFGYARAMKSLGKKDQLVQGKDYVAILGSQGFDAIQGAGGYVSLAVGGSFEFVHRTSVYAPPIPGEPEKYKLAMRMMEFPNSDQLSAQGWSPRKLATYRTFNCDLANAFEYFGSLFDAIAGHEDAFAGVLEGLERDPFGPRVDVRKDFVAHLGQRVTMVTDYQLPITTKSERYLFVVEITDEGAIAKTVQKFMESDPNARKREFQGKTIWEIKEAQEEIPELEIAVNDLDLLEPATDAEEPIREKKPLPSSAVCVTDGHLFIASHIEFLEEILSLESPEDKLKSAADYQEVDNAMGQLLPGVVSARFFVRTDEAYRPVYELLRQGKMPESETLFGRLLNRLLTTPEDEDEGILREQKIDGRQLPDFEMVRRYFSPSGTVVRSSDDGWFIVGATLTKLAPQARAEADETSVSSIR